MLSSLLAGGREAFNPKTQIPDVKKAVIDYEDF
jgi:hypothetical protein